jgi:hypothetical protein
MWINDMLYSRDSNYESNCEMKERRIEEAEFYNRYGFYPRKDEEI